MSARQFIEWQIYSSVEPFGEERSDWNFAALRHAIYDVWRDVKKHPEPTPVADFLLRFEESVQKVQQTYQEKKATLLSLLGATSDQIKKIFDRKKAA